MKSILDPSFHYVSSQNTDLRKTFQRIRREMRVAQEVRASVRESRSTVLRLAMARKSAG